MNIFINDSFFHIYIDFIKKNYNNHDFIKFSKNIFILNKKCYSHIHLFNNSILDYIKMKQYFKNFRKITIYSKASRILINSILERINTI